MRLNRRSAVLIPPIALPFALDVGLTLGLQPADYWAENFSGAAFEAVEFFRWALSIHPALYVLIDCLIFIGYCAVVLITPAWFAKRFMVFLAFTHAFGASTWLWADVTHGLFLIMCLHFIECWLVVSALERSTTVATDS
jgi:hypothetical protein